MITDTEVRPFVVRKVTHRPNGLPESFGTYEIRLSGWRTIAGRLGMTAADLDCVLVSRAQTDLACCPFCRDVAA